MWIEIDEPQAQFGKPGLNSVEPSAIVLRKILTNILRHRAATSADGYVISEN